MIRYIILIVFAIQSINTAAQLTSIGLNTRFNTFKNSLIQKRESNPNKIFSYRGNSLSFQFISTSSIELGIYINSNDLNPKFVEREIYLDYNFKPLKEINHNHNFRSQFLFSTRAFNLYERYSLHPDFIVPIRLNSFGLLPSLIYKFKIQINDKIGVNVIVNSIGFSLSYQRTIDETPILIEEKQILNEDFIFNFGFFNETHLGINYSF